MLWPMRGLEGESIKGGAGRGRQGASVHGFPIAKFASSLESRYLESRRRSSASVPGARSRAPDCSRRSSPTRGRQRRSSTAGIERRVAQTPGHDRPARNRASHRAREIASPARSPAVSHIRASCRGRKFRSQARGVRGGAAAPLRASPAPVAQAASPQSAGCALPPGRVRDRRIDRLSCLRRRVALGVGACACRFPCAAMTA
jgi:hypothetical protein